MQEREGNLVPEIAGSFSIDDLTAVMKDMEQATIRRAAAISAAPPPHPDFSPRNVAEDPPPPYANEPSELQEVYPNDQFSNVFPVTDWSASQPTLVTTSALQGSYSTSQPGVSRKR